MEFPIKIEAKADATSALDMLVDRTTKGMGKLADAVYGKSASDAKRYRELQEAQTAKERALIASGQADFIEGDLIEHPRYPLLMQHDTYVRRQEYENLANTLKLVAEKVANFSDEEVSDEPLDQGLFLRWRREAMCAGSQELQSLFAGLLAGSVKEPDAVSLRTLDVAKNLTRQDCLDFSVVTPYILDGQGFACAKLLNWYPPSVDWGVLKRLQEAGLISPGLGGSSSSYRWLDLNGSKHQCLKGSGCLFADFSQAERFEYFYEEFTEAGKEILKASVVDKLSKEQIEWVARYLTNEGKYKIKVFIFDEETDYISLIPVYSTFKE